MRPVDRIPAIIGRLYRIVAELEGDFPGRSFTLDGHLVGSLGEVLASHYYDLELLPCSSVCHDAKTRDGRMVQIKATQGRSVALRAEPDFLLVIALLHDGTHVEVYNGPGREPWQCAGGIGKNGQKPISLSKLRELARVVPDYQRLPGTASAATTDPRRYLVSILERLRAARLFLRNIETTTDPSEISAYTNAFASTCYSLCECLEGVTRRPTEATKWWSGMLKTQKASPIHRYFRAGRNKDVHEGLDLVSGIQAVFFLDGEDDKSTMEPLLAQSPSYSPGSLASECRLYFSSLLSVSLDAYRLFAEVWDPDSVYAPEFTKLGEELELTH